MRVPLSNMYGANPSREWTNDFRSLFYLPRPLNFLEDRLDIRFR